MTIHINKKVLNKKIPLPAKTLGGGLRGTTETLEKASFYSFKINKLKITGSQASFL
jgi:hypothetical protein